MPETERPRQMPWAEDVIVTNEHTYRWSDRKGEISSIRLSNPKAKITAEVDSHDVSIEIDSRDVAEHTLSKDEKLTRAFRKYKKGRGAYFLEAGKDWVKGEPLDEPAPPWHPRLPGVLDWIPGLRLPQWPKIGRIVSYGTSDEISEGWVGTSFPYVHFRTPDGDEGLVVDWENGPEVWMGQVDEFFSMNSEDFSDWQTYAGYNRTFENGFLWALDRMDVFEDWDIPKWAVKTIAEDPDLLWPGLVEKLVPIRDSLPGELEKALGTWIDRRRSEAEAAAGQQYLWPEIELKYPILASLVKLGYIEIKEGKYVGKTPRGEVNLGTVGFERDLEQYLFNRPDPDIWW